MILSLNSKCLTALKLWIDTLYAWMATVYIAAIILLISVAFLYWSGLRFGLHH